MCQPDCSPFISKFQAYVMQRHSCPPNIQRDLAGNGFMAVFGVQTSVENNPAVVSATVLRSIKVWGEESTALVRVGSVTIKAVFGNRGSTVHF